MTASLLDLTVGALVVGSFLSILTCGIVLCAAWRYYAVYTKDRLAFKLVVTVVLLLSIANTVSDAYWCYNWTVTNYAVPAVLYLMPVSLLVDTFCVGTCALVVQTFFSWRIWKISQERNWLLPVCVTVLSFTQFGIILWVISYWAQHKLLTDIGGVLPIGYIWLSSSLVADFSITCGIVYYLGIKPSIALPSGAKMTFTHIITRTIQANVFSLLPQVLTFALFKVPNIGLYFFLIDFAICKAYAFSVIVSLNTRKSAQALFTGSGLPSGPTGTSISMRTLSVSGRNTNPRDVRHSVELINIRGANTWGADTWDADDMERQMHTKS